MDSQQLLTFIAIAESGSFSAAAQRLHLTQPAISKRVALLEQHLHTRLFDRLGKQVSLTSAGHSFLPHARRILQSVADAERVISDLGGDVAGRLSLATSHHIGLHHLPPILSEFSRRYPAVHLDLHFLDSEKALDAVEEGEFDLGVITLASEPRKTIATLPLWQDQLHFVASPAHALSQHNTLTLADLTQYQAILPEASTHTTRLVQALFEERNLKLEINMATNHLDTIKMMVSIGLGWGVLPHTLLDKQLSILPLDHPPLTRQLGAIYHTGRSQSNAARQFIACLGE